MAKGLLTRINSQLGEIIEYYPNVKTNRHSIHFESEELKDYWIARYLYQEANYDWKNELENQPEFAFIQNTSTSGIFTIKIDYYKNNWGETLTSLLNKDSAMIKMDDGTYALFNLTGATNEGEKNITYQAELNIPFTYQILNLLEGNILIQRTHAKNNFINLDNQKNNNNIQQNFIKREMFDPNTNEKLPNINIPSIFMFYSISSENENPSQNSLFKVKIIPIGSGSIFPEGQTIETTINSTINALNAIYKEKDPLLQYIMILPETPYITKKLKTNIDGTTYWDGELSYDTNYISWENKEGSYVYLLKENITKPTENEIFNGIYKFNVESDNGEFAPKIINFNEEIIKTYTYTFDYGLVYPNYYATDDIEHLYFPILGNLFPEIGEEKIIFFPGNSNKSTLDIVDKLNNNDFSNPETRQLSDPVKGIDILIFPIKMSNIDNLNYHFETPKASDLYNLYNDTWYYSYIQKTIIDNDDNLWGLPQAEGQIVFKRLYQSEIVSSSTYNFYYRINLKQYITNEFDIHLFQSGIKNLMLGIPNTNFNVKIPINYLNNDYIYIIGILDLYKQIVNYFLFLDTYNVNASASNFMIENVQLDGPTISDNYLSWYNSNKTSRLLGRIESSILLVGGLGILTGNIFGDSLGLVGKNRFSNLLGGGLVAAGGLKGLNMIKNKKNLEQSPSKVKTGENLFTNFLQPYISFFSNISQEDKLANFDFSLYSWEEVPENQYQDNKINEFKMHGIEVTNLVSSFKDFGEKKRYQYFEIVETFENITAPLSQEIKQKINENFEKGITMWYFRSDLVFNGIKNYDQENPFIDEEV